ncbi:MAG: HAD hydrolase family protein [Endomicrobium sp.]|jgi:3-deoxy-D-manno-octulosonate 8-phosphate phosphatase (KDO 8-P phosphatase)|nr:HAD hydrolase family protein [Endomicrobium sp.]
MTQSKVKLIKKAKGIKLIACDVDGVLTRGEIIVFNNGEEIKLWNVKDGLGYHELKQIVPPIKTAWITGRESEQVKCRAESMGINYLVQDCMVKKTAFNDILRKAGIKACEAAYIGDDIVDIPVMMLAGFAACPLDAVEEVKKHADMVSSFKGGEGVVRDVIETLLKANGKWKEVLEKYK